MALLRPTRLLISEKSATYTIKWSYRIIWQVRVGDQFNVHVDYNSKTLRHRVAKRLEYPLMVQCAPLPPSQRHAVLT